MSGDPQARLFGGYFIKTSTHDQSVYQEQKRLSLIQLFSELPDFVILVISAVFSGSLIVIMDVMDSFGYIFRNAIVVLISKKLSRNLKYEYNYGSGKLEAITALMCDGVLFLGLVLIIGLSVSEFFVADRPSDMLFIVVGFKVYSIVCDVFFFKKQREIAKKQGGAIAKNGYAAAMSALLFDIITFVSLLTIWLLRSNPVSSYISPAISILIAVYLIAGCFRRFSSALNILTDKSLPEEMQLKILRVLNSSFDRYSLFHSIDSHCAGDHVRIDIVVSFDSGTTVDEILQFKDIVQTGISEFIENAVVNIIVQ